MPTIGERYQAAVQAHHGGRLEEARQRYHEVIDLDPAHADALHQLGLLYWHVNLRAQAVEFLKQAIEVDPGQANYHMDLAEVYRALGQTDEAIRSYQRAIQLTPGAFEIHNNLGTLYQISGRHHEALACYERALEMRPDDPSCQFNRATTLHLKGRLREAAEGYERLLAQEPQHVRALINLGGIHRLEQNLKKAEECYLRATGIEPNNAQLLYNLANVQQLQKQLGPAIANYRQALAIDPNYVDALCNLGNALQEIRQLDEALVCLERAREIRPDFSVAHCNLGIVYQDLGRIDEARQCFERALELEPGKPEYIFNFGTVLKDQGDITGALAKFDEALVKQPRNGQIWACRAAALLSIGEYAAGWKDYEHRIGLPQYNTCSFPQPRWDGSPLGERTLLVHCEQGFGDTFQFIRYIDLIANRGKNILIASTPELITILAESGYRNLVSIRDPLPPFDVHMPLMSLPQLLGTEAATIPRHVPYLAVGQPRIERWKKELATYPQFKVGIVWQGRGNFRGDRMRSMPLAKLLRLARIDGVQLFSLQKGHGSEQLDAAAEAAGVIDLGSRLDNEGAGFVDTAAVIKNLDLVISTDTAVAHLAGGLAAPVWVALSTLPDWRWLLEGDECCWYPTMRLFRQTHRGDWDEVVVRMDAQLRQLRNLR